MVPGTHFRYDHAHDETNTLFGSMHVLNLLTYKKQHYALSKYLAHCHRTANLENYAFKCSIRYPAPAFNKRKLFL
jgi:hypothetical protein